MLSQIQSGLPIHSPAIDDRLLSDIVRWDVGNWSQALRFWDGRIDWTRKQACLELGGREGGLSLWMALKGNRVVCSDIVDVEQLSLQHHRRYGVDRAIQYQHIDATCIPYQDHFDIIAFKSVLGAVGADDDRRAQQIAFDEIFKALKPGGKLIFAENLAGSALHSWARRKFVRWGRSWRYVTLDDISQFLDRFDGVELHTTGVLGSFGRSERQRRMLASVDRALLNHIMPARWQYIVYGIAEKPENTARRDPGGWPYPARTGQRGANVST